MANDYYPLRGSTGTPTFDLPLNTSGVDQLPAAITINGRTVTPTFRYRGGDANATDWAGWDYGNTLPYVSTGNEATFNQGSPGLGTSDDSVKFNSGKAYQAASTTFADPGSDDLILEVVFEFGGSATGRIIGKGGGSDPGWQLHEASTLVTARYRDSSTTVTVNSPTLTTGAWYHMWLVVDESGSMVIYTNGVVGTGASVAAVGTPNSSSGMAIGISSGLLAPLSSRVAYAALYQSPGWLDTHLQADAAKERAARLFGVFPARARGTAIPSTMTRASRGYLDAYQSDSARSMYLVGSNWARVCSRKDASGDDLTGYLSETAVTNLCLGSEAFTASPWVLLNSNDLIADGYTAPDAALTTADGLTADASSNAHGVSQQITLTATTHVFSVWAKAGAATWLYLANQTVSDCDGYFNLETASQTGTKGSGASALFMEDYGNGWRRCGMAFTGTVAAHTFVIQAAQTDADATFAGNGADPSFYMWGAQVEAATYMTSYVPTVASQVTRAIDRLVYASSKNVLTTRGSMVVSALLPNVDWGTTSGLLEVSDGTSTNTNYMNVGAANDALNSASGSAAGTQANVIGTTDCATGNQFVAAYSWAPNDFRLFLDGVSQGTPDVSGTPTDTLTSICVGSLLFGTVYNCLGIVSGVKIYRRPGKKT